MVLTTRIPQESYLPSNHSHHRRCILHLQQEQQWIPSRIEPEEPREEMSEIFAGQTVRFRRAVRHKINISLSFLHRSRHSTAPAKQHEKTIVVASV